MHVCRMPLNWAVATAVAAWSVPLGTAPHALYSGGSFHQWRFVTSAFCLGSPVLSSPEGTLRVQFIRANWLHPAPTLAKMAPQRLPHLAAPRPPNPVHAPHRTVGVSRDKTNMACQRLRADHQGEPLAYHHCQFCLLQRLHQAALSVRHLVLSFQSVLGLDKVQQILTARKQTFGKARCGLLSCKWTAVSRTQGAQLAPAMQSKRQSCGCTGLHEQRACATRMGNLLAIMNDAVPLALPASQTDRQTDRQTDNVATHQNRQTTTLVCAWCDGAASQRVGGCRDWRAASAGSEDSPVD